MTQRLKDLAKELAQKNGIRLLKAGETRPPYYYGGNHVTGQPFVRDKNAVVRADAEAPPDRRCGP
jgi:hypothetical protein